MTKPLKEASLASPPCSGGVGKSLVAGNLHEDRLVAVIEIKNWQTRGKAHIWSGNEAMSLVAVEVISNDLAPIVDARSICSADA